MNATQTKPFNQITRTMPKREVIGRNIQRIMDEYGYVQKANPGSTKRSLVDEMEQLRITPIDQSGVSGAISGRLSSAQKRIMEFFKIVHGVPESEFYLEQEDYREKYFRLLAEFEFKQAEFQRLKSEADNDTRRITELEELYQELLKRVEREMQEFYNSAKDLIDRTKT